jgi:hypothetical protein
MNENRIAQLARAIVDQNKGDPLVCEQGETYGRERLADAMLAMNLDAFRQRYDAEMFFACQSDIELDSGKWRTETPLSDMQFFKSLQCFLYQCCEGNVDERPLYKTLKALLELQAVSFNEKSPDYEAAQWG